MPRILAAADIGSNTAHLLIASVEGRQVTRISDTNEWLALGEKVSRVGFIPADDAILLRKTLKAFRRLAHLHGAEGLYIFATEAIRKAENSADILGVLEREGMPVEVIDGRREAEFGLLGAWADCSQEGENHLMVEVGGGSAQIANITGGIRPTILTEHSLPLGTGTLRARLRLTQPSTDSQLTELTKIVKDMIEPLVRPAKSVFGVGGVARGLWRSLHPDGNQHLCLEELEYLIWATSRLTDNEIAARFNIKLRRAVTLLPGAVVCATLLRCVDQSQLRVSRFGVREGAVLEMAQGRIKPWRV
jgi:exopolyphosphatase / guanosine-5'-triphosphate,3'-diphosphate pyrophosphatase